MKVLCERCGALAEGRLEARPGGGAGLACGACGAEIAWLPSPTQEPSPSGRGHADAAETAEGEGARPPETLADEDAWSAVLARWDDEEAHLAFLARFPDLEGLAGAGRRYREVLAERPGDPAALRWRDEILKRATVQGLMQLPRGSAARGPPKLLRWAVLAGTILGLALAAAWTAWRFLGLARG